MTTEILQPEPEVAVVAPEITPDAPAVEIPAVAEVAASAAPEGHTTVPTLLTSDEEAAPAPTEEVKPTQEKAAPEAKEEPAAEVKPEESPPTPEVPAVALTVEDFTLPEGVTADREKLGAFATKATELGLSKDVAQSMLDMHTGALKGFVEAQSAEQHRVFGEMRSQWRNDVMADEQIGGAGHQTAMAAIARTRDLLVPKEDRAAFNEFLMVTGAGDHPALLKMLHNAARYFDEGQPVAAPKPPADIGKKPGRQGLRSLYNTPGS